MKNPKELYLVLQKKWFLEILKGTKKTEYRSFTDFYLDRLTDWNEEHKQPLVKEFDTVKFVLGYSKDRPEMIVECKGIFIEHDPDEEKEFLTPENCEFAIDLGDIIHMTNCENLI